MGIKIPRRGVQRGASLTLLPAPLPHIPSVLAACHGFNLDVEEPRVFQEDGAGFGQSVAQFGRSR